MPTKLATLTLANPIESHSTTLAVVRVFQVVVVSSFPFYPIHLAFLVVNQYELQSPIKQIL